MSQGVFATTAENDISKVSATIYGDFNQSGSVTASDAIHLLYYTMYGESMYPINQDSDFNGDDKVDSDDAVYLLFNSLYGENTYPLNKGNIAKLALPLKTYAIAGQPIKIYFLNLTEYNSLSGLRFEVKSNVSGTVYADRWEYVPTKSESVFFSVSVYDRDYKLLNRGYSIIEVADKSQKENLSVMVIGDSTVNGSTQTRTMVTLAKKEGYNLTLLGSRGDGTNRHEGRSGWTASNYVNSQTSASYTNAFYNPDKGKFDFAYYMQTRGYSGVDCVVIQLGINDIFYATTNKDLDTKLEKFFTNMEFIMNSIHDYDRNIKIVWDLVTPGSTDQSLFEHVYGTKQTAERHKLNTYLANLKIMQKYTDWTNLYIAPINLTLDTTNNMMGIVGNGSVHPSSAGYTEMGTMLYSFVRAIN